MINKIKIIALLGVLNKSNNLTTEAINALDAINKVVTDSKSELDQTQLLKITTELVKLLNANIVYLRTEAPTKLLHDRKLFEFKTILTAFPELIYELWQSIPGGLVFYGERFDNKNNELLKYVEPITPKDIISFLDSKTQQTISDLLEKKPIELKQSPQLKNTTEAAELLKDIQKYYEEMSRFFTSKKQLDKQRVIILKRGLGRIEVAKNNDEIEEALVRVLHANITAVKLYAHQNEKNKNDFGEFHKRILNKFPNLAERFHESIKNQFDGRHIVKYGPKLEFYDEVTLKDINKGVVAGGKKASSHSTALMIKQLEQSQSQLGDEASNIDDEKDYVAVEVEAKESAQNAPQTMEKTVVPAKTTFFFDHDQMNPAAEGYVVLYMPADTAANEKSVLAALKGNADFGFSKTSFAEANQRIMYALDEKHIAVEVKVRLLSTAINQAEEDAQKSANPDRGFQIRKDCITNIRRCFGNLKKESLIEISRVQLQTRDSSASVQQDIKQSSNQDVVLSTIRPPTK